MEFSFFTILFIIISIFLEVSLKDSIINFDSYFDYNIKFFRLILSCNFIFNIFLKAFVKLGCKSFVVSVGLSRILLEVCYIDNSRFSLLKILNDLFGGSVWINISKDFNNFFLKVCKDFEDFPDYWFLSLKVNSIFEIVVKMQFDSIESCSG